MSESSESSEGQRRDNTDEHVHYSIAGPVVSISLEARVTPDAPTVEEPYGVVTASMNGRAPALPMHVDGNGAAAAVGVSADDVAAAVATRGDDSTDVNQVNGHVNGSSPTGEVVAVDEVDTVAPEVEAPGGAPGDVDGDGAIDLAAPASSVGRGASTVVEPDVGVERDERSGALARTIAAKRVKLALIAADAWAVATGLIVAVLLSEVLSIGTGQNSWRALVLVLASLPVWLIGISAAKGYVSRANVWFRHECRNVLLGASIGTASVVGVAFVAGVDDLRRSLVALVFVCGLVMLVFERAIARQVFMRMRRAGRMKRRIVVVGTDAHAIGLMHAHQRRPDLGYEVAGFVGADDIGDRGVPVLGGYDDLEKVMESVDASGIVVSLAAVSDRMVNDMTRRITDLGYHVTLSTTLRDIDVSRLRPQSFDGRTMIYVEPTIRTGWRKFAKRLFDVTAAASMIVLTAPIMLLALLAIRIDSRGPLFFRQVRLGIDGREFKIIKLRTMVADAESRKAQLLEQNESDGPLFKMKRDPRITRVGRFLRKTSIDELPQLWNVLTGDMSLVGPRPALPSEAESWNPELHDRLRVLPGITGMWQVYGRSEASFEEYQRFDLYYVDNWSLFHDIRIVARTVLVVLGGKGAS